MSTKAIFGGALACILLVMYAYFAWLGIADVTCTPRPDCQAAVAFTSKTASALALIAGLVSALVIAELAITPPGEAPLARTLDTNVSATRKYALTGVTFAYLAVWTIVGLAALLVGVRYDNVHQAVTDLGQSWFGFAIAAGYSYFGIDPKRV